MKKTKVAKALLPFMLLGSPAMVVGSSIRSGSRTRIKKAVVQSVVKAETKIDVKKEFKNPFSVFGSSKTTMKKTKDSQNDVLSFLNEEGLLESKNKTQNKTSGEISGERRERKVFLVCTYTFWTSQYTCEGNGYVWLPDDTTAPTLSAVGSNTIAETTANIVATSNESGTMYYVITTSATPPTNTQVLAGQDNTGSTATKSGNSAVTAATAKTFNVTGLTGGTTYYYYFAAKDAANNVSTVSAGNFTTVAANTAPTITGAVADQAVNDNATLSPFSAVTLADTDGDNISMTITLDTNTKGILSGTGLSGSGPYTLASDTPANVQANLRALVFSPAENRVAPAGTETTTFTLVANDGTADSASNTTTTVISTSVNDAPTDIALSSTSVNQSGGANATVGTLSATDPDTGESFTYSLVAGSGDTNNGSFNVDGTNLRANDSGALSAGTYDIRVNVNDGDADYSEAFNITVVDDVVPTLTSVTAESDNSTNSLAKVGDTVTLTFTASETFSANPTVTIAGQSADSVTNTSGLNYTATRVMQSSDTEGTAFTIDFSDSAGNAGTQVTTVTSGSAVTFDKTAPSGYSVDFTTDPLTNSNKSAAAFVFASAETGTTYNYTIDDSNGSTAAVTGSGTIATATDSISSIDLSSLDDDTLTLSVTLTDPAGNVGASVTDTVVKDVIAPTLTQVTAVATPTTDSTPDYVFNTNETGTLAVGGSCGSSSEGAIGSTGDTTIALTQTDNSSALADGTYTDCTITLTDSVGNTDTLSIPSFTVDTTAPTATFNPTDASNTHPLGNSMTITFDESVRNTDDSTLTDANIDSLITLKETDSGGADVAFDATIGVNKEVITINPDANLVEGQTYYLAYSDVEDSAGNIRVGENITFEAAADTVAPTVTTLIPTDNNTSVLVDTNLTVIFDESIQAGIGNIELRYDTNDSVVETFDVTSSGQLTIVGDTLTIDPTDNLDFNTKYYVLIDSGSIKDNASTPNNYAGLTVKGDWDFTTFAKVSLTSIEGGNLAYSEGDGNVSVTSSLVIDNPSSQNITDATISITSGLKNSEDKLHFTPQNNITGEYNTTSGTLSLTGADTVANYQDVLRSITYENSNTANPDTTSRVVSFKVSDSIATSESVTRTIDVASTNDAPIITTISNIAKDVNFSDFNLSISGIDDLDREDLNITLDTNTTAIINVAKTWDNNLTYAEYKDNSFDISISSIVDQKGSTTVTVNLNDSNTVVSEDFIITVKDTTPDTVDFTDKTNQSRSTSVESDTITITGIDDAVDISIVNGEYEINKDGNWASSTSTIDNDDNITVRLTTSGSYATTTTATLTVGSTDITFSATTGSAPSSGGGGTTTPPAEPEEPETEEPTEEPTEPETPTEPEEPVEEPTEPETPTDPEPTPEEPVVEPEVKHELGNVTATSELEGTQTQTDSQTGDVITSTTTTNDADEPVAIEVVAKASGDVKASHTMTVGEKQTKAESELPNTSTTIRSDKSVETKATLNTNGAEIKVVANPDGSALHTVKLGEKESRANSEIRGAQTHIGVDGKVRTSVAPISYIDANGCSIEAVVSTDADGQTLSRFAKRCDGVEQVQDTTNQTTPFEAGNNARIYEDSEDNNRLKLKIKTPVTKRLQF